MRRAQLLNFMVRKEDAVREILSRYRGSIISGSTEVEEGLLFWLNNYFLPEQSRKSHILYVEVLNDLSFSRKIDLYKKIFPIHYGSKPRSKKQSQIINALGRVNNLRNDVAHGVLSKNRSSKDTIILFNFKRSGETMLDHNTIQEFENDKRYLLEAFFGREYY